MEDELKHAAEKLEASHIEKKHVAREKKHSQSEDKPKEVRTVYHYYYFLFFFIVLC